MVHALNNERLGLSSIFSGETVYVWVMWRQLSPTRRFDQSLTDCPFGNQAMEMWYLRIRVKQSKRNSITLDNNSWLLCNLSIRYKLKCILNAHLKSHTKFEFKCNQCEKVFRKKISLKRHLEYHTGTVVKPFACDYCDKTFRLNFNLVEHRRIHTGEKPFACEHCSSTFRTMSNFYSHLRKEHGKLMVSVWFVICIVIWISCLFQVFQYQLKS